MEKNFLEEAILEQISRDGMSELYGGDGSTQTNTGKLCSVIDNNKNCKK